MEISTQLLLASSLARVKTQSSIEFSVRLKHLRILLLLIKIKKS